MIAAPCVQPDQDRILTQEAVKLLLSVSGIEASEEEIAAAIAALEADMAKCFT